MAAQLPTFDELLKEAVDSFEQHFNCKPTIAACAPGRVNLIGDHVDYCDGFVLPMALPMVTMMVGRKNGTPSQCNIATSFATDEPKRIQFETENLCPGMPKWANYVKGVICNYGYSIPGFDAVISTNVPVGGGLSSSAALEVATLKFLELLTGKSHANESEKALICQKAEQTFANMPCGIMDQFISVMGRKRHALLIDCQSLTARHIPLDAEDLLVLICNSNVKHELSSSEYPTRRRQCNEALKLMGLKNYQEANLSDLRGLPPRETLRSKKSPQPIEQTNPPNLNSIDGKLNTELTQSNEQTQELLSSGSDQNNSEGSSSNSSTESGEATNTAQTNQEPLSDPGKPPDPPGESEVLANTQTKKLKMPFEKLPSIEKLTRLNYEDWSVRVKLHLKLRDHWIEPNTAINTLSNAQKEINIKAGNFLILSIDNENRQMLSDADHDNFIVAWNKLRDIHQPRTQATLAEIYGNITHARHTPGSSINNHLIYLQTQFAMLADMREQLTEKQKVAFIQGTLRDDPEFGEVIKSSNWQDPNNLTSHKICQVLNASCSNKQFATSSVIEAHSSQFRRRPNKSFRNKRQRTFKCPPCGMNNHTYKDCGVNNPANSKRKPDRTASAEVMEHDSSSIKSRLGPSPRIKYRDERDLPASSSGESE